MANQEESDDQKRSQGRGTSTSDDDQTGDPGRTPGTAEGDEQTIDEDLRQKGEKGQK